MNRRSFLVALIAAPALAALATACGDPQRVPAGTDPTTPAAVIDHPTGAADIVVRLSYEGGLVPVGYAFVNTPALLVSGDGRVFTPGVTTAIYPGPLLPSVMVRSITEQGVQALLGVVERAGLLATPPEYPDRHNVVDASNTVLTITAAGGTFVHKAYGLGIGDPETGTRKALFDVVTTISDLSAVAGSANLGVDTPFVATSYRLQARAVDPSKLTGQTPAPTIVDWPTGTAVSLADAGTCARLDAVAVGSMLIDAKQNTYFKDGDIVYQLAAAGVLPGDPAC